MTTAEHTQPDAAVVPAAPQLIPGNSLITATPDEGRLLAVRMAQLVIKFTQPDTKVRELLRPGYSTNAADLIAITHTVALEFATIAAANHYWRPATSTAQG
ncbi:hexameric tyrosine-coordinated heme protein [Deinococcus alpinitundrae]|uniref:hexameric tyrosine-coordinated heme protein n=1 Tax=Deinococcus alpinitundrae TaxID=468913 RepID=UPI00137AB130|nr:hexameric tyrosine-coordinated heme protein [Deinococcus alpinitundrae]